MYFVKAFKKTKGQIHEITLNQYDVILNQTNILILPSKNHFQCSSFWLHYYIKTTCPK